MGALFLALLLGVCVGLRSLTPPAAVSWAATLYWIDLGRSRLSFLAAKPTVGLLTLLALTELVTDKLPSAPDRTRGAGLLARIILGALCGACVAIAGAQRPWLGALVGLCGGLLGCYGGFQVRTRLVKALKVPDYVVAVCEDVIAIAGSFYVVTRF